MTFAESSSHVHHPVKIKFDRLKMIRVHYSYFAKDRIPLWLKKCSPECLGKKQR